MALAKQITQCHFENSNFVNGNEGSGTRYNINYNSFDIRIEPEFYTGNSYDKALSGKLRQNLRGYRIYVTLSYNQSLQQARMRDLFNDIITALVTNNEESITFYPNATLAQNFEVVIDQSQYNSQYDSTIGSFIPSLELVSLDIITSIQGYLEAP